MTENAAPQLTTEMALQLAEQIKLWGQELGFDEVAITDIELAEHEQHLKDWLSAGFHGEMKYMADHGNMRSRPDELLPGTIRVISARMDYLPEHHGMIEQLTNKTKAYISRYALGRDYHKLIRKRMTQLGKKIEQQLQTLELSSQYRAFVDSAPVLERAIGQRAGHGWIGKNAMLINRKAGSYFFLAELFVDIPLPVDQVYPRDRCSKCTACIDLCPTNAFVGDRILDARKCISYLTIELDGPIPEELRKPIGNRIFGCDDCQICCPWNKIHNTTKEQDFTPRHNLAKADLIELFLWDEKTFLQKTEGNPIRRTGFQNWQRNIAVALGNAPSSIEVIETLKQALPDADELLAEHINWALKQHQ